MLPDTGIPGSPAAARQARPLPNERAAKPRFGRWISWAVLAIVVFLILNTLLNNRNIDLGVIGQNLVNPLILEGLVGTVVLALVSTVFAIIIGVIVGYARISASPVARTASWIYVWFFRSIPVIVLILIFGNFALFLPTLGIGVPFTNISFFSVPTNAILVPMVAGAVALSLEQGGYFAEIVRAGVSSVPDSQREAASALGLSAWDIQRKVVLPQAIPLMIPPAGSSFIILLKSTSLVFAIAGTELLGQAENIASRDLKTMELLFVASIWYLLLTSISSVGQRYLERRFSMYRRRVGTTSVVQLVELKQEV
jgi:polar amino acid transport system permease protein